MYIVRCDPHGDESYERRERGFEEGGGADNERLL